MDASQAGVIRRQIVIRPRARIAAPLVGWSRRQSAAINSIWAIWIAVIGSFVWWWLRAEHVVSSTRMVISTVLLVWTILMPSWFLYFARRAVRPSPDSVVPAGKVAMVVTKAPSEPWDVVQKTLEGMLAQSRQHDTWLADEQPDERSLRWCAERGVKVSSRHGVAEYHRPDWPRRTRSKEGNLSYFYDTVGYDRYEFVVQLDADHVPSAGYLESMLRPFSDGKVGYVSAPSICDANADASWTVRARAWAEAAWHGVFQAGASNGFAPMCIGSHYAVRTRALRQIGGIGPELAEDHSTTLLMHAGGWRGVHAIDAIAHGDGPESFEDLMVQEFQWARSLMNILLRLTPRVVGSLSWRMRIQFLFCQLWYPTFGLMMATSVVLPVVALRTSTPWMRVPYPVYAGFAVLATGTLLLAVRWTRRQQMHRPADAPILRWEIGVFQLMRWPWVLLGCLASILDCVRGSAFEFKVTPKRGSGTTALPVRVLVPHVVIAAVSVAASLSVERVGAATGYHWFAVGNAAFYTIGCTVVVGMHIKENRGRHGRQRAAPVLVACLAVLGVATASACVTRSDDAAEALTWTGEHRPEIALGNTSLIHVDGRSVNLGVYDYYQEHGESRFAIGHHFVSWLDTDAAEVAGIIRSDAALDRWPLLTVEPFAVRGRESTLLEDTVSGTYDDRIDEVCGGIAQAGHPAFVRWGHEMEVVTGRYPWATADSSAFVEAFRYFAARCRAIVPEDLYIVWSPAGNGGLDEYWPGGDSVDWIGLSLFDFPDFARAEGTDPDASFSEQFEPKYNRVKDYEKSILIAEFGTTRSGQEKVDWINDALASAKDYPRLATIVAFHGPDTPGAWGDGIATPDWRIEPRLFAPRDEGD